MEVSQNGATPKSSKITLWLFNIAMEKSPFLIGKPSINWQFSMAMLNNQRVPLNHPKFDYFSIEIYGKKTVFWGSRISRNRHMINDRRCIGEVSSIATIP
jgi:hypothetical protein